MISTFLVLWFHYYLSYNRVLDFIVSFLNKLQVCSWFFGLIVSQVTSAFLDLRFHCYASYKRVLGFMEMYTSWFIGQMPNETDYKLPVCSWFFDLNVSQVTIALLVLHGLIVAQIASAIFFS